MHILEAILAFALTMAIFSTLTTFAIQLVSTVFDRRERSQRWMLERFFDRVLTDSLEKMRVDAGSGQKNGNVPASAGSTNVNREDFVRDMTGRYIDAAKKRSFWDWFAHCFRSGRETHLSSEEFVRRLARSSVGGIIAAKDDGTDDANSPIRVILAALTQRFSGFASDTKQRFAAHSRLMAGVFAVSMALYFNIDASRLFAQFLESPVLNQAFVESDAVQEVLKKQLKLALNGDDETAARKVADLREKAVALYAGSLAIGHSYFPYCEGKVVDEDCISAIREYCRDLNELDKTFKDYYLDDVTQKADLNDLERDKVQVCIERKVKSGDVEISISGRFWLWLFWAILTGLLIGLGGPFWFEFYAGFSRVVGLLRTLRGGKALSAQVPDKKDSDDSEIDAAVLAAVFRQEIQAKAFIS